MLLSRCRVLQYLLIIFNLGIIVFAIGAASSVEVCNALLFEGLYDWLLLPVFVEELVPVVGQDCLECTPEFICDDREGLDEAHLLLLRLQLLLELRVKVILIQRGWVLVYHH